MTKPADLASAVALRERLDRAGRQLVFTTGCFDILHAGHVRYLSGARALGNALVVGLNSDASVRDLKGFGRPVNGEGDRAEVLLALECVDGVVVFPEMRSTRLIRDLRPHVYAKGGDYSRDSLDPDERAALDEVGAEIHILPLVAGRSTTAMIEKMGGAAAAAAGGAAAGGLCPPAMPDGGSPLRLAVLGSGKGSNFAAVLDAIDRGQLEAEVRLAVTDVPGSGVASLAEARGIPVACLPGSGPGGRFTRGDHRELHERVSGAGVDLVVLAGFMRVVKDPLLSAFGGRIINIHPSLLPAYPGKEAWKQAIEAGATESGCTVHLVDAQIDGGETLAQRCVPVLPDDTPESLHARIQIAEHELLPEVIGRFVRGEGVGSAE